jgi:hypothetical protein
VAKLIEAYQLPAPDFILSIQMGSVFENNSSETKSGIRLETEHAIGRGLTDTAKKTRE